MAHIKPSKLLRYEIWSSCDYRCRFCCWENSGMAGIRPAPLSRQTLSRLCRALAATGCHNLNLTGGEPLLMPEAELCESVNAISSETAIKQLWATTNGAALRDIAYCRRIAGAGLKQLAVSVAAETDEKYRLYSGTEITLTDILGGIRNAISCGMDVRAHIPLNPVGVSRFSELERLLRKLEDVGVRTAFFFRLHNSEKICKEYSSLYISPSSIIREMEKSPDWQYAESGAGRPSYTDGIMTVHIPRERIALATGNCIEQNCGDYCQGIYSAYLVPNQSGWHIRACHRVFVDGRNEYPFDPEADEAEMASLLQKVWRYAYE